MTYKNKEKLKAYQLAYYQANKDKINLRKRNWRLKNLDSQREYHAKWMKENRNEEYAKSWRENNKEWIKNWNNKNHTKFGLYNKRYHKKNKDNPEYKLKKDVNDLTRYYFKKDKECGICKTNNNLQFHHWIYKIPVERKHFSTLCADCHNIQHGGMKI